MISTEDEAVEFAKDFLSRNVLAEDVKAHGEPSDQELEKLEQAAKDPNTNSDTNDYDVLIVLACEFLRDGLRLPDWLALFAADVLEGKRVRPTKRGPDKYANWPDKYGLFRAVEVVSEKFNMPAYTNNELSVKTTAAHIVSKAASCPLDTVVKTYQEFQKKRG